MDLQISVELVPIIIKVVSSNPTHGEVYSIQLYVIKFVSDLRQVGGFLLLLLHYIAEVTLNTITLTLKYT